jgi:adenylate cyclase
MPAFERRLAAILSADIAGYSRLMADDEEATIAMVTARHQQVRLLIEQRRGRLVDFTGDNFLAEFGSAVDAIECAMQIQSVGSALNASLPESRKMEFRIGIHLGEIQVQDERLFGKGVNIAARLEALARPGGVCISAKLHEEVAGRTAFSFHDLGPQTVKNIPDPVHAYAVLAADARAPSCPPASREASRRRPRTAVVVASLGLAILLAAAGSWWWAADAGSRRSPTSVVVLPFDDMSPDGDYAYFGEGISEELTNVLAQLPNLKVIGRTSAKAVYGEGLSVEKIGDRLGVGAVIEGSVRRDGERLRITVQVIETRDGFHLWSRNFDRRVEDLFAVQSEISADVAAALDLRLTAANAPPPTSSLAAYDAYLTGRSAQSRQTPEDMRAAIARFEEATRADPDFGLAYSGLADALTLSWALGLDMSESIVPRARRAARMAVEHAPDSAEAHTSMGRIHWFDRNWSAAEDSLRRAIELNPGYAFAHQNLALVLVNQGIIEEGVAEMNRAVDLEPLSPFMAVNLSTILGAVRDPDGSARAARAAIALEPENPFGHLLLAGALWNWGDGEGSFDALMNARLPTAAKEQLRLAHAEGGIDAAWARFLDLIIEYSGDACGGVNGPGLHAMAGRKEMALECLERAVDVPGLYVNLYVKLHPLFDSLRSEPRFDAVLAAMNLAN